MSCTLNVDGVEAATGGTEGGVVVEEGATEGGGAKGVEATGGGADGKEVDPEAMEEEDDDDTISCVEAGVDAGIVEARDVDDVEARDVGDVVVGATGGVVEGDGDVVADVAAAGGDLSRVLLLRSDAALATKFWLVAGRVLWPRSMCTAAAREKKRSTAASACWPRSTSRSDDGSSSPAIKEFVRPERRRCTAGSARPRAKRVVDMARSAMVVSSRVA